MLETAEIHERVRPHEHRVVAEWHLAENCAMRRHQLLKPAERAVAAARAAVGTIALERRAA